MNEYQFGAGVAGVIILAAWVASLEIRRRRDRNQAITSKQAETDAKIKSAVRILTDAERAALADSAVDRYSKD